MATLVVKSGEAAGTEFTLIEGLNRIGRAPGNEIRLDDASISASHCELWLMKERLLVRDLGSTNGTFINGRPVTEGVLSEGDLLSAGRVAFLVVGVPGHVAIPEPPPPPPPPPRFAPDGFPCCVNHWSDHARFRCRQCGEQFCRECVRLLGRRGGVQHAFCPLCGSECVEIVPPRQSSSGSGRGWLAKLTQTLRLRS